MVEKLEALQQVVVVVPRKRVPTRSGPLRDFLKVGGGWAEVGSGHPHSLSLRFQKPAQWGGHRAGSRRAEALEKVQE